MNFYAIVIGTELLNGRREDLNTPFLKHELTKRHWKLEAVFTISDQVEIIKKTLEIVKHDPKGVLFCFGGIGSTPDDYTRACAASVFSGGKLEYQSDALAIINRRFTNPSDQIKEMVNFPVGAQLLSNPINEIPGFYLEDRFFFTPGFPSMAQPMIIEALDRFFPVGKEEFRRTLTAFVNEGKVMEIMEQLPSTVTLSSLPDTVEFGKSVSISLSGYDKDEVEKWFLFFADELKKREIEYKEGDLQSGI